MSPRPRKIYANTDLLADETTVATLDPPADPTAIAERVSRQQADRQIADLLDAVSRWRTIVADVSAGKEPDGQTLDQIGELVNVLRLPSGSLASHVAAWRGFSSTANCPPRSSEYPSRRRSSFALRRTHAGAFRVISRSFSSC